MIEYHHRLKQKCRQDQNYGDESKPCIDSATKLAIISSKCTRWARDIAVLCGKHDFEHIYPHLACRQDKANVCNINPGNIRPFPNIFKRENKDNGTDERIKKRSRLLSSSKNYQKTYEVETTHAIPML